MLFYGQFIRAIGAFCIALFGVDESWIRDSPIFAIAPSRNSISFSMIGKERLWNDAVFSFCENGRISCIGIVRLYYVWTPRKCRFRQKEREQWCMRAYHYMDKNKIYR